MSVNQISVDILKDYVEKAIEKWQKNELQAQANLAADDFILNGGDDIPDPKDKDHPYNRFLNVVAADMVSVFGENQKTFFRQLFRFSNQWQELLAPKKAKPATTNLPKKKRAPKLAKNEFDDRKKSRPAEVVDDVVEDDGEEPLDDDEPPRSLEGKRKLFEEGRDAILAEVPDEAKARFGQIYFAKWVKQALPVLVLNPYSVPPGAARKHWVDMFDNLKKTDRLSNITNLVYWYGSSKDPNNCYSIWTTKNLISYEMGIKQKFDQINPNLQKKIDEQSKLSATEIQLIEALKEMKDDLVKEPHERRGYIPQDFLEVWELWTDDEGNAVLGEKPIATKKKVVRTSIDESTTKKKTTSSNKRKKDAKVMDDPSDVPPKKPKIGKKSKSSQSSDVALPASLPKTSEEGQAVVQALPKDEIIGDTGSPPPVAVQPNFVDAATKAEQDDYEYKVAMGLIDSDESLDEDSSDPLETPDAIKPKKHRGSREVKEPPKKKAAKTNRKLANTAKKVSSEKDIIRKEQEIFAHSEEEFHPVFDRWQKALVAHDREAIMEQLHDVHARVQRIHLSLMPNINELLKATKKVLSEDQKETLKILRSALKTQYDLKKEGCPANFTPKRKYAEVDLVFVADTPAPNGSQASAFTTSDASKPLDFPANVASMEIPRRSQPPSPLRRSGSLEKVSEKPEQSTEGISQHKEVKVERKKFSLGNLMRPTSDGSKTSPKGPMSDKAPSIVHVTQKQATLPQWVTGNVSLELPTDDRRSFGFEFIRQAVPFIQGKGIDHHCIACALEASIDSWSRGNTDKYWKKIDDVVVALSGDKKVGTLASMIAKGVFKDPREVVGLSDALIYDSFLGKPLLL